MKDKRTIFSYGAEVLIIYAVGMIIMMLLVTVVGEEAREVSKMYSLGKEGVPIAVMWQFLVFSFMVTTIKGVCFDSKVLQHLSVILRAIIMMVSIVLVLLVFVVLFQWFPMEMWEAWVGFFLSFSLCTFGSVGVMILKTKLEDKKMEKGLENLRRKWEEEDNGK